MQDYMKIRDAVTDSCEFGPGHYNTPQAYIKDNDRIIGAIGVCYLDNYKYISVYFGFSDSCDSNTLKCKNVRLLRNLVLNNLPEASLEFPVFNESPMNFAKGPFVYARTHMNEDLAGDMLDRIEIVIDEFKKKYIF